MNWWPESVMDVNIESFLEKYKYNPCWHEETKETCLWGGGGGGGTRVGEGKEEEEEREKEEEKRRRRGGKSRKDNAISMQGLGLTITVMSYKCQHFKVNLFFQN